MFLSVVDMDGCTVDVVFCQHALCAECKTWMSVLPCLHIYLV
jgi:hypothetical protein